MWFNYVENIFLDRIVLPVQLFLLSGSPSFHTGNCFVFHVWYWLNLVFELLLLSTCPYAEMKSWETAMRLFGGNWKCFERKRLWKILNSKWLTDLQTVKSTIGWENESRGMWPDKICSTVSLQWDPKSCACDGQLYMWPHFWFYCIKDICSLIIA